jgi:glycerol-3-phosphate dehydrogenase
MVTRDGLTGVTFPIKARVTLNAAGARAGDLMRLFGVARPFPLVKAMNLLTSKRASDMALAAPGRDGRMLTLVPWRGRALVGTSQSAGFAEPGDAAVSAAEIDAFVADANHAFPALQLSRADVTLIHRGIVPAVAGRGGAPDLKPSPEILDHATEGADGAVTVVGIKYTTARHVAERTSRIIAKRLHKRLPASRTAVTALPGAGIADHEALAIETARGLRIDVPLPVIRHLIRLYAETAADVIRVMHERADLRAPVSAGVDTLGAEIVHVIRHEMSVRLTDIVVRRTGMGSADPPPRDAVDRCAHIAAEELGWDGARVDEEIAGVARFYKTGAES